MKYKTKKLICGVGKNDYEGKIFEVVNGKQIVEPFYKTWSRMINRCYNAKVHGKFDKVCYSDCSVHPDWLSLSKFKEWFDLNYKEGWSLDKDLLVKTNKVYSPDACVFIPEEVNNHLVERTRKERTHYIGISHKVSTKGIDRYVVNLCRRSGKGVFKGLTFDTELEAHLKWKELKHKRSLELIEKYPDMSEQAKEALRTRYAGSDVYEPIG